VRFKEMRLLADIREGYQMLEKKINEVKDQADTIIAQKKTEITNSVMKEFKDFFLDQGFDVTSGEDESTAEYKSVNIVLKAMDPGRRKDDITCLIRFKLLISASDPEGFDVFIRWSGIGDIKTDPTDIRTDTNIGKIIKALYQLTISSEEVLIATKKAAAEFKIEKNIAVIKNLYQELNSLCQTIQEERDKWMAFRKDEYFYWICQEHEEWDTNKGHRYESMSDILKSLDVISSVK